MYTCTVQLLVRLAWSNIKAVFYVSIWLFIISLIVFKVFGTDIIYDMNINQYSHENTLNRILQFTTIFILGVSAINSLFLIFSDIKNYAKYKHQLDDPNIRTRLLIEAINASQINHYYLEELRAGYFRLAYRTRTIPNSSRTVIDGNIRVIKKYLICLVDKLSFIDRKSLSLCHYNKKCLEYCNIKHFNLVKRQLHS